VTETPKVWNVVAEIKDDYAPTQFVVLKTFTNADHAVSWMDSEECDLEVQALNDDLTKDQWLDNVWTSGPVEPTDGHTVSYLPE